MDITLSDLLIMEPRLQPGEGMAPAESASRRLDETTVSWAVTARTTLPYLPPLRGGELLLLPERAVAAVGDDVPALIREASARGIAAVVVAGDSEPAYPMSDDVCALRWSGPLSADTETDINRLLTACRGDLYRIGTELERRMADVAAAQSGLETLARVVAESTGLCLSVVDGRGRRLVESGPERLGEEGTERAGAIAGERPGALTRALMRGATLILAADRPEQRIVARFLIDRIAAAANAALLRDDAARPRGAQRAEATAMLLAGSEGSASGQRSRALALGLDPDAVFFVAISDVEDAATLARALATLGAAHPAGDSTGHRVTLIAATVRLPSETLAGRVRDVTARWEQDEGTGDHSLALSGPAMGVASLPRAAREAEFVAAMQAMGDVSRRAAAFDSAGDLGAMSLLYLLRDTPELRGFVAEALGSLPVGDPRGTLRATLRAFLESGGSQVDASQRLGIHRNTLSYRLRRLGELIGRDVADPTAWLTLHLAIRAADVLDIVPDER